MTTEMKPTWTCFKDLECTTNDNIGGDCRTCNRWICTPANPVPSDHQGSVRHAFAREIHDSQTPNYPAGDLVDMECKGCAKKWRQELPQ